MLDSEHAYLDIAPRCVLFVKTWTLKNDFTISYVKFNKNLIGSMYVVVRSEFRSITKTFL